jgi:NADH-quinone oxidoreductase subunit M
LELYLIPLAFALLAAVSPAKIVRFIGLIGTITSFVVACIHVIYYLSDRTYILFQTDHVNALGLTMRMGYDGIGLLMVILVSLVNMLIVLSNVNRALAFEKSFFILLFIMQFGLLGVFTAMDGIMFYVFWELTLIPIFLISFWHGTPERKPALVKFFIYTFVGSLAMLLSIILLGNNATDYAYESLVAVKLTSKAAFWVMSGFFIAFAIKIPLMPFHTWQPNTYTYSPMAGTMLLSALMLKMALYGMIRWMVPTAPEALMDFIPIVVFLGVLGVVYAALLAIKQTDIKRLFAYASISHVGLIAAGIILFNREVLEASLVQIINHSLVAMGLFLAAGIIEDRLNTRELQQMGGIAKIAPRFAFWFAVICFASVSVPFTSGFIGEFLLIKGLYSYHWLIGAIAGTTLVFGAVYTFRAYQISMFGPQRLENFNDLKWNEVLTFFILTVFIVLIGIFPQVIFDFVGPSLYKLLESIKADVISIR